MQRTEKISMSTCKHHWDMPPIRARRRLRRCWATVKVFWLIASSPNHCDWYQYLMIRAFAIIADSMCLSLSQLIYSFDGPVSIFLHHMSSEWAPVPCTTLPSSRARRSRYLLCQPMEYAVAAVRFRAYFEPESPTDDFKGSIDTASPRIIECKTSSLPIKSRITRRVTRCQKESLSAEEELRIRNNIIF